MGDYRQHSWPMDKVNEDHDAEPIQHVDQLPLRVGVDVAFMRGLIWGLGLSTVLWLLIIAVVVFTWQS
jgi:hypothetical protein